MPDAPTYRTSEADRANRAAWRRRKRRMQAYGQWQTPLVSPEAARAHVESLRATYLLSLDTIGQMAGMTAGHLEQVMLPGHHQYRQQIGRHTQERLLAVRFDLDAIPDESLVTNVGTVRRIQALMRIGWTLPLIAQRLGLVTGAVSSYLYSKHSAVRGRVARRVRDLYDEIAMTPGPSAINKRRCEARGWPPPLAWDDETIDDPAATPDLGESTAVAGGGVAQHVLVENVEDLLDMDLALTTAGCADRLGLSPKSLKRALERAGRLDLRDRLTHNAQEAA